MLIGTKNWKVSNTLHLQSFLTKWYLGMLLFPCMSLMIFAPNYQTFMVGQVLSGFFACGMGQYTLPMELVSANNQCSIKLQCCSHKNKELKTPQFYKIKKNQYTVYYILLFQILNTIQGAPKSTTPKSTKNRKSKPKNEFRGGGLRTQLFFI